MEKSTKKTYLLVLAILIVIACLVWVYMVLGSDEPTLSRGTFVFNEMSGRYGV